MDKWNRELLDKYCREYSVGIVGFVSPSEETLVGAQLRNFPLYIHTNLRLRDARYVELLKHKHKQIRVQGFELMKCLKHI